MENFVLVKNKKQLNEISRSLIKINLSDFIMCNLIINEEIYDSMNESYENLKEKFYWNFSEILYFVNINHPRIHKYTILRHLKYSPSQESLLNQLIQNYYEKKDYKKCKILIRVK
jgi:hypothetical protein